MCVCVADDRLYAQPGGEREGGREEEMEGRGRGWIRDDTARARMRLTERRGRKKKSKKIDPPQNSKMADPRLTPSERLLRERMVGGEAETRGRRRGEEERRGRSKVLPIEILGGGGTARGLEGLQAVLLGSPVMANDAALKECGGRGLARKV